MTNSSTGPDLSAIVREAEAEILISESMESSTPRGVDALSTAELGYYEAELGSLRDAAASLEEAEHPAG
jgi:hypothetical protein